MVTLPSRRELESPVARSDLFASGTLGPSALCCCHLSERSGMGSLYLLAGWLVCLFVYFSFSLWIRSRSLRIGFRVCSERLKAVVPRGVSGPFWEARVADWSLLGERELSSLDNCAWGWIEKALYKLPFP